MSYQSTIFDAIRDGEALRDVGIQMAVDHADGVSPGWSQKAFNLFASWLKDKGRGRSFKTEDFRNHCELTDAITKPPSSRAYGSLAVRAAKAGLIKKVGFATVSNPKAHCTPVTLWEVI